MATDDPAIKPSPWRVESSRPGHSDQFLSHRMDRCITERGQVLDPYHVLDLKDWCHVVALTPDGRLVIIEEYRHGSRRVERCLPGGTVDPGEDALTAMRRELTEETAYVAPDWITISTVRPNPALQSNRVTNFLALDAVPSGERSLDLGETIDVFTMAPVEAFAQAMAGDPIGHAMHVMGLLVAQEYARTHLAEDPRLAPLLG